MDTQEHGPPHRLLLGMGTQSILHPKRISTINTNKTTQQGQGRPRTNNTQCHPDDQHKNKQNWIPKHKRKETKTQVTKQV